MGSRERGAGMDGARERRSLQTPSTQVLIVLPWTQVVPWQTNVLLICFASGRDLPYITAVSLPPPGPS